MTQTWARPYILADDLTGCCDAALPFLSRYEEIFVCRRFSIKFRKDILLVSSTASRALSGTEAANRVRKVVNESILANRRLLMKKIDSTLRGPVAEEAEAVMTTGGYERIIFCSAFPAQKRTVRDGILRVDGVPLSEIILHERGQAFHLPDRPAEVLEKKFRTIEVSLETVRQGAESLTRTALEAPTGSAICVDAESEEDLDFIASAVRKKRNWLCVGAAGLAGAMARQLPIRRQSDSAPKLIDQLPIFLVGSLNPRSRAQVANIARAQNVRLWAADPGSVLRDSSSRSEYKIELGDTIGKALRGDDLRAAVVIVGSHELENPVQIESAAEIALWMARLGLERCKLGEAGGVLCCGGDIGQAVFDVSEASSLRVEAELIPGIAQCQLVGGQFDGLPVVTKPGGFGDENALAQILSIWTGTEN